MISKCRFIFTDFCVIIWFFTKLLISRILYSTAVNTVFVGKPLILGILFSISLILVSFYLYQELYFLTVLPVSYLGFKINLLVSMLFILATNLS